MMLSTLLQLSLMILKVGLIEVHVTVLHVYVYYYCSFNTQVLLDLFKISIQSRKMQDL